MLRDWQAGRVTIEGARRDYGVAIENGAINEAATTKLRQGHVQRQGFDPGPTRRAHEARWTKEAYAALHQVLAKVPVSWRALVKKRIFAAVKASPDQPVIDIIRQTEGVARNGPGAA